MHAPSPQMSQSPPHRWRDPLAPRAETSPIFTPPTWAEPGGARPLSHPRNPNISSLPSSAFPTPALPIQTLKPTDIFSQAGPAPVCPQPGRWLQPRGTPQPALPTQDTLRSTGPYTCA